MSEILLIRHAETDMAGSFCGHSDPEINLRGHDQISNLIDRLAGEDISLVCTSDLRRAVSTATEIAKSFHVECHVHPALREINFGRWEGLIWSEIEQRDPEYACLWMKEYPNLAAPDGERICDFEDRVLKELRLLSTQYPVQTIAVVTHAGVIRTILRSVDGDSYEEAWEKSKHYCDIVRHSVPPCTYLQQFKTVLL